MKKRIMAITLAMVTLMSCLTGCGDEKDDKVSKRNKDTKEEKDIEDDKNQETPEVEEEEVKHIAEKYKDKQGDMYYDDGICYEECATTDESDSYSQYNGANNQDDYYEMVPEYNTEQYDAVNENGFRKVSTSPLSTFGADVDTASYANMRRFVSYGYGINDIPDGAIRTEEMLNYFTYNYSGPQNGEPFGVNCEISACPWNPDHKLVMMGLQTDAIDFSQAPDSNIVFLIDVSGSMYDENKLPLLKKSFELMIDNLTEKDKVSIVTYASGNQIILDGVPATEKERIIAALESLEAGGSTNGAGGIVTAYELAEKNYIKGGNNRVIIATDGDFNVGLTSESDLEDLISEEKENNIFLSVLGFGMGNYADARMETLADKGNGNYAYIDNLSEAKKVLVDELGANMVVCAKDVKFQVEFNPAYVAEYRLIGYEDRAMANEDFNDDKKDGGEIGSGHSVTVMYEIVLSDGTMEDDLKYQESEIKDDAKDNGEWFTLSVRYKDPNEDTSKLLEYALGEDNVTEKPSDDFIFASCVVEFAEILRKSEYNNANIDDVLDTLKTIELSDDYRKEFGEIVYKAKMNQ